MPLTPNCVRPASHTKKKATEMNAAHLNQELEKTVVRIQTSDEQQIFLARNQFHIFQIQNDRCQKLELEAANKQRITDKLCAQVKVLLATANWLIVQQLGEQ